MNQRVALIVIFLFLGRSFALGQQTDSISPQVIILREAVELAVKRRTFHDTAFARFHVDAAGQKGR